MKPRNPFEDFEEYFRTFIFAGEIELAKKILRRHMARVRRHPEVYPFPPWRINGLWFEDLVRDPIPKKLHQSVYVSYGEGDPCYDA